MNYAFRCSRCNSLIYRNTTRIACMMCPECRKSALKRCKSEDKKQGVEIDRENKG